MRLLLVPTLSMPLSVLATVLCLALPIAAVISRPAAAAKPDVKAPPAGGTTTSQAFPFPVKEKTLANGLRVYVVAYDSPGLVAYYSIVRTGSRNEVEPGKSGFAHFFEHMMFRGTEHYSQDAYNAVIKEMGADSNAFTSDDLTVYHILAGKTALPRIVEIEADRFQHLQYKEPDFQKEARAVLGEYNKNASNPMEKMVETLYDNAYTTHTYKHTTMGFLKDIENMPNQFGYSRQFFDRYYRPDTVTLLVRRRRRRRDGLRSGRERVRRLGARPGAPAGPARAAAEEGEAGRADLEGRDAADADGGLSRARLLDDQRRPAGAGRAGRAAVRRARAAVQEAGDHRAEGRDARRARPTRTSIRTCSRSWRASRSRPTSPTSRRRSTTRSRAWRARGSTTGRSPRCCRT